MRATLPSLVLVAIGSGYPVDLGPRDGGVADAGGEDGGERDGGSAPDAGCTNVDAGVMECRMDAGGIDGGECEGGRDVVRARMRELAADLKGPGATDLDCVVIDPFLLSCDDGMVVQETCPHGLLASRVCELEARFATLRAEACEACARFGCIDSDVATECGWYAPHCIDGLCAP